MTGGVRRRELESPERGEKATAFLEDQGEGGS